MSPYLCHRPHLHTSPEISRCCKVNRWEKAGTRNLGMPLFLQQRKTKLNTASDRTPGMPMAAVLLIIELSWVRTSLFTGWIQPCCRLPTTDLMVGPKEGMVKTKFWVLVLDLQSMGRLRSHTSQCHGANQ